jgi:peptidoglycan/xylan/chitin deacetylase (PgdA/CDA1 family)
MLKKIWNRICGAGEKRALILMYHHVCEKKSDPWQLAVHPDNFQKQLDLLNRKFKVVSMEELVLSLKLRTLKSNMVAVTLDDGFADNYLNAAPLLEWYRVPATFYLTTNPLRDQKLYWWEELQAIILFTERLPKVLNINLEKTPYHFEFKRDQVINARTSQESVRWIYGQPPPNERVSLFIHLWKLIQPLQHLDQYTAMRELRAWAGIIYMPLGTGAPMKIYHMQKLCKNSLFSLGAHTVNHAMLGPQTELVQTYEICESKNEIENLSGKKVEAFAYPYGNYTSLTQELLKKNGYDHAVTTERRAVSSSSDVFALPRMQVLNWKPEELRYRMNALLED